MTKIKTPMAVAFAAASLFLYTLPVAADEPEQSADNTPLEEVFVLGKRRAYQGNFSDLETPAANQTLSEELLRDAGVISLDDALDLSASVARQNNFGGLWNSFSVRGFAGDNNLPSGFLVNGFNAGRGFAGPRDMVGIESVEVLKGPRSALFGRGEPGGTVNLITKRPQFETSGIVRATLGRWDQRRVEGDYQTTTGANDSVGLRLVGFFEDAESFRETVETERLGLYPSISWVVSESTNIAYELEYTAQEIPFDRGVSYSADYGFTPHATFVGEPGDGPIDTEVLGHQFEIQHTLSDRWSVLGGLGYRDTSFEGNASEPNFGGRQSYFVDGQTLSRFFRYRDFESDYFVARAELAGDVDFGGMRHRLLIGLDYDRFENSMLILRARPGSIGGTAIDDLNAADYLLLDVFNPVYGQYPLPAPGPNTNRQEDLDGIGFYVQDQIDVTDRLQVRLGLRWDDFEQGLTNLRADPVTTATSSDTRVSPQFGAVFAVNPGVSVYASYGEGFRQQSGSDYEGRQFDPNITDSAEIGLKLDMAQFYDGISGALNVAVFRVEQSNILVNDNRPLATAAGFFSVEAGEARSQGLEVDANLAFENGTDLWFSYAYTNAEFTNSNPDADFGAQIEDGDSLINSPKNQVNLQLSRRLQLAGMPAQVGTGLQYTDERLGWTAFDFMLPSYTTVRFFGEIEPANNLTVRFDLDNAFDKEYYTNSYADVWVGPGMPRRYRLTASYAF